MKIRVGVIGVGYFGEKHVRVYSRLKEADLVAIADISVNRAREVASKYKVPRFYQDYREMIEEELDAVSVVTPEDKHRDPVIAALRRGIHVLVEKPIATSTNEAREMIEEAERRGLLLMVGHVERFNRVYRAAKERVSSGVIGEPLTIFTKRVNPRSIGEMIAKRTSVLWWIGIHDVDLANWFAEGRAVRVYAEGRGKLLEDSAGEDLVWSLIKYDNGCIACIHNNWIYPSKYPTKLENYMEICGNLGVLRINLTNQGLEIHAESEYSYPDLVRWLDISGEISGALKDEIKSFVSAIIDKREAPLNPRDALEAVKVVEAIAKSIKEQREVRIR